MIVVSAAREGSASRQKRARVFMGVLYVHLQTSSGRGEGAQSVKPRVTHHLIGSFKLQFPRPRASAYPVQCGFIISKIIFA
jgi:hypothetical protein